MHGNHLTFYSRTFILITLVFSLSMALVSYAQVPPPTILAQNNTIDELKNKISDRSQRILDLEKEIAGYQKDLEDTSKQKSTLQATVRALELARAKLAKEVSLASNKIEVVSENITVLEGDIESRKSRIKKLMDATSNNIRELNQTQGSTLIELALSENTLSSFLDKAENIIQFQKDISRATDELRDEKKGLEVDKAQTEEQKKQLVGYKSELTDKQKVIEVTKAQQNSLLIQTKNKESNFQKTLKEKVALRSAFEQELLSFESALKFQLDPTLLPPTNISSLVWPLAKIRITQLFGHTEFSKTQRIYNGKGHNGIDLAASIGTPILAAADGVVLGSGNTDTVCPGASFGKWILIEHNNGLSTVSGHLSLVKAATGQIVRAGDVVAYSGNTGYVTGPHLHFGVYASQGIKIQTLKSKACKGTYTVPLASLNAYLDPMLYLPKP